MFRINGLAERYDGFNLAQFQDMYYDDEDYGFAFPGTSDSVAWQEHENGAWGKTHYTKDNGKTTLCGLTVPDVAWMTDSSSAHGRCKRCLNKRKSAISK